MKSKSSTRSVDKNQAISLLKKEGCDESLMKHVCAVSRHAKSIAESIKAKGVVIDVDFVETAALLHDIGRCRTHGIKHGIEGAKIMEQISPDIARVCERHIGAGIDRKEAEILGLPVKDYLPMSLEEKVIAHADNLTEGDRIVPIEETVKKFESRLGAGHPAVKRIIELNDYIESLCKDEKS
ncbi:MAG: TIGR00295 family protein [Candidatus Altiarchaeia archaeon]